MLNELLTPGQFIATDFRNRRVLSQACHHCHCRKLRAGSAGRFEYALALWIEMINLFVDHLLDAFRHSDIDVFDLSNPTFLMSMDESFRHHEVDSINHEQRISVRSLVDEPRKFRW